MTNSTIYLTKNKKTGDTAIWNSSDYFPNTNPKIGDTLKIQVESRLEKALGVKNNQEFEFLGLYDGRTELKEEPYKPSIADTVTEYVKGVTNLLKRQPLPKYRLA